MDSSANDIQVRRLALGLSVSALAKEAKVDRSRVDLIERDDPKVRDATRAAVLSALERLEARQGELPEGARYVGDPAEGLIEISMGGVYGVKSVVVKGPVGDAELIRQTARELIRDIRADNPDTETQA